MNLRAPHRWRAVAVAVAAASAPAAAIAAPPGYCDPLNGCKAHYVKVSPAAVRAGKSTKVYGSVGGGCRMPGTVTVYSRAFKGATKHDFAGVPAIFTRTDKKGRFTFRVTIKRSVKAGRYHIGARCGGGNFGSATLRVT